jgi:CheY-specific phosphatase CheX
MSIHPPPFPDVVQPVLVEVVQLSIVETLGMMLGNTPEPLTCDWDECPCDGICGTISFLGDPYWSMVFGSSAVSATAIATGFTGMEIDFDSPDMGDAIGELVNIVAGDVVARLEERGVSTAMSLPNIVRGHDIEMVAPRDMNALRLSFSSEQGPFWIEIIAGPTRSASDTCSKGCPICGR